MATVKLSRFARVDVLRQARPKWLKKLFDPHESFFTSRGVVFDESEEFDYEKLAKVFVKHDPDMPDDLIESLFFILEMSKDEDMARLLDENGKRPASEQISFDFLDDPTPMEVAIQAWLEDRTFLEEKHAEQKVSSRRSFKTYPSHKPEPLAKIDADAKAKITDKVDDWLVKMKRERNTRIVSFNNPDGVWFMIRHGLPFRRENSIKKGKSGAVYFQPEHFDVVVYDPDTGDLRINAENDKVTEIYRKAFGSFLFGSEDRFQKIDQFSLDPLLEQGEDSLVCSDIKGLDQVTLKEVVYYFGGSQHESLVRRADDIFAALREQDRDLPSGGRLSGATFEVKFTDVKAPRKFTIRTPNSTKFTRDEDAMVLYEWMRERGFIVKPIEDDEIFPDADMATASV